MERLASSYVLTGCKSGPRSYPHRAGNHQSRDYDRQYPPSRANSDTGQCNAIGPRLFSNTTNMLGGHDFFNRPSRVRLAMRCRISISSSWWRNTGAAGRCSRSGLLRKPRFKFLKTFARPAVRHHGHPRLSDDRSICSSRCTTRRQTNSRFRRLIPTRGSPPTKPAQCPWCRCGRGMASGGAAQSGVVCARGM